MSPSVESSHAMGKLFRNSPSASCTICSAVIKEIRSSLLLATSIIDDEALDEYIPMIDEHRCKNTQYFLCGRLKYSFVKEEWSLLHRALSTRDDITQKSSTSKNPVALVIASLRVHASHSKKQHFEKKTLSSQRNNLSTVFERRRGGSKRRKLLNNEDDIITNDDDVNKCDVDIHLAKTGPASLPPMPRAQLEQPISPPLDLVRSLFTGAEFISMMDCARQEVETSIQVKNECADANSKNMDKGPEGYFDEKNELNSKARFWSRRMTKNLKRRSINLQPMIASLVESNFDAISSSSKPPLSSTIYYSESNENVIQNSSPEIIMLNFIDECIRYAHKHTLDIVSHWSSCWQMRTSLRSAKVDDENGSSSSVGTILCRKRRMKSRRNLNRSKKCDTTCNKKESFRSISRDTTTIVQDFVRECLAKPWEDVSQSNIPMECTTKSTLNTDNYRRALSPAPKRAKVTRRNKVLTREPPDSLAATFTKKIHGAMKKEQILERQRHRRVKYSRQISPPSPSVLENTATMDLGKEKPIQMAYTNPGRVSSDLLPLQMTRCRRNGMEKSLKGAIAQNIRLRNSCEPELEKEEKSPNSLFEFFEKKKQESIKKVRGSCYHISYPEWQEAKDRNARRSPRTIRGWGATLGLQKRKSRNCFRMGRETEDDTNDQQQNQQRKEPIDSLHSLPKLFPTASSTQKNSDLSSVKNTKLSDYSNSSVKIDLLENQSPTDQESNIGRKTIIQSEEKDRSNTMKVNLHKGPIKLENEPTDEATNTYTEEPALQIIKDKNSYEQNIVNKFDAEDCSTKQSKNKKTQNPKEDWIALESVFGSPWVNLTHIGHISDYHGYKRKYEHFAPLQFGPIDDIRRQIGRTLIENKDQSNEESDEEVIQDNMNYEQAIKRYEYLAERERSKKKSKIQRNFGDPQKIEDPSDDMLVMFAFPESEGMFALPVVKTTDEKCTTEMITKRMLDTDESSLLYPQINFQVVDDGDAFLLNTDEDNGETKRKRKSRSAQIATQKKSSIRILNELLHTLDFIEEYNCKSKKVSGTNQGTKEVKQDANDTEKDDHACRDECEINVNNKQSGRTVKVDRRRKKSRPVAVKPPLVTLTTTSLLKSYQALRKRFSSFYPLHGKGNIKAIKEEIESILEGDTLLNDFFTDDEIISEEKDLARCIRGYSNKADQEKIEKRNFEEQQKLRQHEFEYYRSRRKKRSPEEIEWKEMPSRPVFFVTNGKALRVPTNAEIFNFRPGCMMFDSILNVKSCHKTIFFPRFRHTQHHLDVFPDIEPNAEHIRNIDTNFIPPHSKGQKLASSLKLLELYHTLDFIDRYNDGMIISRQGRKYKDNV